VRRLVSLLSHALLVACASLSVVLSAAGQTQTPAAPGFTGFPTQSTPMPGTPPWMETWTGFGFTNHYYGGWFGGVAALNNTRNVWSDGFVVRFEGTAGHYDYRTSSVLGGEANATLHGGGLMVGYRAKVGEGLLTGYVGWNYEHHQTNDLSASIHGTEVGAKVLAEYYTPIGTSMDFYGQASYSSAFDTFYLFARPGFKVAQNIWIGPEASLYGNRAPFQEWRAGAFIHLQFPQYIMGDLIISGGYRDPYKSGVSSGTNHGGSTGYYAQIGMSYQFR
jgi:cellulose biosynthesis protein BcsS